MANENLREIIRRMLSQEPGADAGRNEIGRHDYMPDMGMAPSRAPEQGSENMVSPGGLGGGKSLSLADLFESDPVADYTYQMDAQDKMRAAQVPPQGFQSWAEYLDALSRGY